MKIQKKNVIKLKLKNKKDDKDFEINETKKQKISNDKNNNNENNTVDHLKDNEDTKKKCYQIKIEKSRSFGRN